MDSILLIIVTFILYLFAYRIYGTYLSKKIFNLKDTEDTPAHLLNDNSDYVPTKMDIVFGHHYTSIAGTGPIVGPAIGIIWGWVPALIWVIFGSIFIGAVHDFSSLVVSLRNDGKSIGDIAAKLISKRVRLMFLALVCLALTIVIAVFCLVIAFLFSKYPASVIPIWTQIPIAMLLGRAIYGKKKNVLLLSIVALFIMYVTIVIGAYCPVVIPAFMGVSPVVIWSVILLIYAFWASVLPVWKLLQPRDYINGHQLFVAMFLLVAGIIVSHPEIVAPAYSPSPEGAPSMIPFIFIVIACGAVSGFHSLVSSGTTAKQLSRESDAKPIGYGSMLLEGLLAVFVIIAVSAGIGLETDANALSGAAAWHARYGSWSQASGLGEKVGAFVLGAGNMVSYLGIPHNIALAIMGVFVASFAGTTLDTATRLQRYAVSELSSALNVKALTGKYAATIVAVLAGGVLALCDGKGKGGLILWPLFGATNQLLASLALMVVTVYLAKNKSKIWVTAVPYVFMFVITGWSMAEQLAVYIQKQTYHLAVIGILIVILEIWMIVEALIVILKNHRNTGNSV